MKDSINVLSLFDGMSCGQIALERAGISVNKYYASELDAHAMKITQHNYPNTIQLGDVTKWKEWDIDWASIDLVIGGSPCQGFSFAGKQLNFDDPRSKLFFEFVDICHRVADENPKMKFMLENVRMKKEYQDVISKYLGVEPIAINSSLVSAQNRYRLYWTNIPNVTQPEDKGILLRDIILDEVDDKYYLSAEAIDYMGRLRNGKPRWEYHKNPIDGKSACLTANMHKGVPYGVLRITGAAQRGRYLVDGKRADHTVDSMSGLTEQRIEFREDLKSNCLTSVQKDSLVGILIVPEATKKGYVEINPNEGVDLTFINSKTRRGRKMEDKSNCLTAANYDYCWYDGYICRKLTPIECERLQTVPDNYTSVVSNTQRYKALGNGWTVDVIAHIFDHL
jgi:DNA (cytosine-5)-methyltransferase 3A